MIISYSLFNIIPAVLSIHVLQKIRNLFLHSAQDCRKNPGNIAYLSQSFSSFLLASLLAEAQSETSKNNFCYSLAKFRLLC